MKSEWRNATIAEVCSLVTDGSHFSPPSVENGEYMVSVKDFTPYGFDFSSCRKISKKDYDALKHAGCVPEVNDILIGKDGARYFEDIIIYSQQEKPALLSSIAVLRCNSNIISPKFMYYILKTPSFRRNIKDNYGSGSAIPRIILKDFRRMQIAFPPIEQQNKIVAALVAIDSRIQTNEKINDNLEQQAQALFMAWFVDFLPFGGYAPDEWNFVSFFDFLIPRNEKSNDPSLILYSVTDAGIFPRDEKFKKNLSMTNAKSKVVRQTDLVFGMSREILNWGVMRDTVGGVSSAYNVYIVGADVDARYLQSYIKANMPYFHDLIKPASREGQGVDKNALMQKKILMPSKSVLEAYYAIENTLTARIALCKAENARLSQMRDALLPKLMSGEIDVSNIRL